MSGKTGQQPSQQAIAASSAATNSGAAGTSAGGVGGSAADASADSVDAQSVRRLLAECGVPDYEPGVVQQLVEFMYRYCTDLLDDAKAYSQHAGKKTVDIDDLKLAVACHGDLDLVSPPPRELLSEVAQTKNSQPLPPIKTYCGVRLPPEKFCLTQPNYKAKLRRAEARTAVTPRGQAAAGAASSGGHHHHHQSQHPMVATPGARAGSGASSRLAGAVFPSPAAGALKRRHPDAD